MCVLPYIRRASNCCLTSHRIKYFHSNFNPLISEGKSMYSEAEMSQHPICKIFMSMLKGSFQDDVLRVTIVLNRVSGD